MTGAGQAWWHNTWLLRQRPKLVLNPGGCHWCGAEGWAQLGWSGAVYTLLIGLVNKYWQWGSVGLSPSSWCWSAWTLGWWSNDYWLCVHVLYIHFWWRARFRYLSILEENKIQQNTAHTFLRGCTQYGSLAASHYLKWDVEKHLSQETRKWQNVVRTINHKLQSKPTSCNKSCFIQARKCT